MTRRSCTEYSSCPRKKRRVRGPFSNLNVSTFLRYPLMKLRISNMISFQFDEFLQFTFLVVAWSLSSIQLRFTSIFRQKLDFFHCFTRKKVIWNLLEIKTYSNFVAALIWRINFKSPNSLQLITVFTYMQYESVFISLFNGK